MKQKTKHTPGPWSARYGKRVDGFDFACIIEHSTNKVIIDDVTSGDRDAALIAAAPEMLEALERIQEILIDEIRAIKTILPVTEMLEDIKTAIAKAKGGA